MKNIFTHKKTTSDVVSYAYMQVPNRTLLIIAVIRVPGRDKLSQKWSLESQPNNLVPYVRKEILSLYAGLSLGATSKSAFVVLLIGILPPELFLHYDLA
jgi:hypothetical protein